MAEDMYMYMYLYRLCPLILSLLSIPQISIVELRPHPHNYSTRVCSILNNYNFQSQFFRKFINDQ